MTGSSANPCRQFFGLGKKSTYIVYNFETVSNTIWWILKREYLKEHGFQAEGMRELLHLWTKVIGKYSTNKREYKERN